jgi:hypothetical protein
VLRCRACATYLETGQLAGALGGLHEVWLHVSIRLQSNRVHSRFRSIRMVLKSHCSESQVSYPDTEETNDCAENAEGGSD